MKALLKIAAKYKYDDINDPGAISHVNRLAAKHAKKMYGKSLGDLNHSQIEHVHHRSMGDMHHLVPPQSFKGLYHYR